MGVHYQQEVMKVLLHDDLEWSAAPTPAKGTCPFGIPFLYKQNRAAANKAARFILLYCINDFFNH